MDRFVRDNGVRPLRDYRATYKGRAVLLASQSLMQARLLAAELLDAPLKAVALQIQDDWA